MTSQRINILLAKDNKAECLHLSNALTEFPPTTKQTIVDHDEQLIEVIKQTNKLQNQLSCLISPNKS